MTKITSGREAHAFLEANAAGSASDRGGFDPSGLDAAVVLGLTAQAAEDLYVSREGVWTRSELGAEHPLEALGHEPEQLFVRQAVYDRGSWREVAPEGGEGGGATRVHYPSEAWRDFLRAAKMVRAMRTVIMPALAAPDGRAAEALRALLGAPAPRLAAPERLTRSPP